MSGAALFLNMFKTEAAMTATTSFQLPLYAAYIVVAASLTVVLARILFQNGQVFLDSVFKNDPAMARAVNRLLVVGFYLVNLGYAFVILKANATNTAVEAVETLAAKLGLLLLSLAAAHFANLYIFHRIKRSAA
jgi:hypothetical protein